MKVSLNRKDILTILRDLEATFEAQGNYAAAVSIEMGRAALKRVLELEKIVYISPGSLYVEAEVKAEEEVPKK